MSASSGGPGYETRDTSLRLIIGIGAGIVILMVAAFFLMEVMFRALTERESARQQEPTSLMAPQGRTVPPDPRLEADPLGSLADLRAMEEEVLTTYGWVDPDEGVVRIPIRRAMELAVERGLAARPEAGDAAGEKR